MARGRTAILSLPLIPAEAGMTIQSRSVIFAFPAPAANRIEIDHRN
jgi:hypothetical protein